MSSDKENLKKAKYTWDHMDVAVTRSVAWLSILSIDDSIKKRFSNLGGPLHTCHEIMKSRGLDKELFGAALVCGDMESERMFFDQNPIVSFKEVHGFDLSDKSLARVRPTSYTFIPNVIDCNELELVSKKYDFVIASHGAHHVFSLDNFFFQVSKSLKPRGLFYMYEWIGPKFLQIPRLNNLIARLLLLALFPLKRTRTTHMGKVKGSSYLQDPPESFDPSEACNSESLYKSYFKNLLPIEEYKHGGLCYPMFEGIAQNLNFSLKTTRARVKLVLVIESFLTHIHVVKPLFVCSIAEKRISE
jgi:SAM-dependent methyltransferase